MNGAVVSLRKDKDDISESTTIVCVKLLDSFYDTEYNLNYTKCDVNLSNVYVMALLCNIFLSWNIVSRGALSYPLSLGVLDI